ncbi:Ribosome biogenesis ATPase rix7 [Marasmius tenuissimus]|uniref:Ribosome biogenesis ATPase rix7 n=1 Tax=Marasmius tenuissimus TaxID=585030 RepID=A0ABR3A3J9_9AGAR
MQGLWSRRGKVNLNAVPTPTATTATPASASAPNNEEAVASSSNSTPHTPSEVIPDEVVVQSTSQTVPLEPPSTPSAESKPSSTVNGKRKMRRTVDEKESGSSKRQKTATGTSAIAKEHTPPSARLADLGGVDECISKLLEVVAMPLCHPEIYLRLGVQPPRGVLLHGPPGCGKTLLANAMAGELGIPFINISAPSIVSGMSGESEKTLREAFDEAKRVAPCLLFIDEIDAITPKRESAQREMERRIVAQFLTCMDDLSLEKTDNKPVIVMGATNRPDSLDAALRRAGRFDHEISMGVPDDDAREKILRVLSSKLRLEGNFNFAALAKATPGYVGADLSALTAAAGIIAVKRIFQQLSGGPSTPLALPPNNNISNDSTMQVDEPPAQAAAPPISSATQTLIPSSAPFSFPAPPGSIASFLNAHPDSLTDAQLEPLYITYSDFTLALKQVQPSSKREGFATVPDVTWSDVGALHETRGELHMAIVQPIKRPELFSAVGIEAACGVLLWGPPGCGKTLLAKAVANESRANFISVKGPELLNKSESSARVVNTLLTELDGLDARKSVYVIAATNRPDMIDPAMVRPGRLDKLLYVDLPSPDERAEIVRTMTRKVPLGIAEEGREEEVRQNVEHIVRERCDGYSGADLAALVREAGVTALKRTLGMFEKMEEDSMAADGPPVQRPTVTVEPRDFVQALDKVTPSVSYAQRRKYESLRSKLSGLPVRIGKEEEKKVDEKTTL